MHKAHNIIILGPQGSGKGTQGALLAQKYGYLMLSAGEILREIDKQDTNLGRSIHQTINVEGRHVEPRVITQAIGEKISSISPDQGLILESYPRNLEQYQMMKEFWPGLGRGDLTLLVIELLEQEAIRRLLARGRVDDQPQAIKTRLDLYASLTLPMIAAMKKDGVPIVYVNGAQSIASVHEEIVAKLMPKQKRIITITGLPGSGKSSTARGVAKALGYEHFSSGDLFRKIAAGRGLSIEEINFAAEKQREIDLEVDHLLVKMGKEKNNLVIDSRMAWHWIPDSFKVFLDLDPQIALERTFAQIQKEGRASQDASTIEEVRENTLKRVQSEQKRYWNLYHVDITDKKQFDLVVDTGHKSIEEVVSIILEEYQKWLS